MPVTAHYRRIHSLLLNPDTAILATISAGQYLIDRSVLVCISGPAALPTITGALSGLSDGVYKMRVTLPPLLRPELRSVPGAIESTLNRLRQAQHWRPVTATGWCWLNGDGTAVRILARNDISGPHHTAVNASLWHRWVAQLADLRFEMRAYQPDGKPRHALRIDMAPKRAPATTIGYIMPTCIHGDDRLPAEYLVQRTALQPLALALGT
jgi:hypothetical protein